MSGLNAQNEREITLFGVCLLLSTYPKCERECFVIDPKELTKTFGISEEVVVYFLKKLEERRGLELETLAGQRYNPEQKYWEDAIVYGVSWNYRFSRGILSVLDYLVHCYGVIFSEPTNLQTLLFEVAGVAPTGGDLENLFNQCLAGFALDSLKQQQLFRDWLDNLWEGDYSAVCLAISKWSNN